MSGEWCTGPNGLYAASVYCKVIREDLGYFGFGQHVGITSSGSSSSSSADWRVASCISSHTAAIGSGFGALDQHITHSEGQYVGS